MLYNIYVVLEFDLNQETRVMLQTVINCAAIGAILMGTVTFVSERKRILAGGRTSRFTGGPLSSAFLAAVFFGAIGGGLGVLVHLASKVTG
jgi:hypothetical protein